MSRCASRFKLRNFVFEIPPECSFLLLVSQPKTVRFDALVKTSGQPEQVTLWTKPEDDADFMKAVRDNRVATVIQQNVGTKKDFGVVGFDAQKNAAYLIFPKPIPHPAKTKIVGIKYERISAAAPKGPVFKPKSKPVPGIPLREKPSYKLEDEPEPAKKNPSHAAKAAKREKAEPKLYRFTASVTVTAVQKISLSVQAPTASAAAKLIRRAANDVTIDVDKAEITRRVGNPKKSL